MHARNVRIAHECIIRYERTFVARVHDYLFLYRREKKQQVFRIWRKKNRFWNDPVISKGIKPYELVSRNYDINVNHGFILIPLRVVSSSKSWSCDDGDDGELVPWTKNRRTLNDSLKRVAIADDDSIEVKKLGGKDDEKF